MTLVGSSTFLPSYEHNEKLIRTRLTSFLTFRNNVSPPDPCKGGREKERPRDTSVLHRERKELNNSIGIMSTGRIGEGEKKREKEKTAESVIYQ